MKAHFSIIALLAFVTLGFLPNSFAQEAAPERMVRLIYCLPNDRPFRPEVVQKMKDEIRNVQTFFGEQMQAHGHGYKTFRIETDAQGEPIVHRVDGQHPDSHYHNRTASYGHEIRQKMGVQPKNVYFMVWDNSTHLIRGAAGWGGSRFVDGVRVGGSAEVPDEFGFFTAAHELGHALGLFWHDFRDERYIMGHNSSGRSSLSACAAEFLSVHPYFNPDIPLEKTAPSIIELISPRTYPVGTKRLSIQLKVSDPDGLHQVLLLKSTNDATGGLKMCRSLKGEKEAIVEFDYDVITPSPVHRFGVVAVDIVSDVDAYNFILVEEISSHHIATLEGHTGIVASVTFSPDGSLLASESNDKTVKLWDVATRTNITTLEGHTGIVTSVAFSPDGVILASGSFDGTVKLWDVATRTNIATLEGYTGRVASVAFSPDGVILASGSSDGTVKLWDVETRTNIATLEGHTGIVYSVAFSPDGSLLASGSYDGTAKLWDVVTKRNITTLLPDGAGTPRINSVAFSPDGETLAAAQDYTRPHMIRLWDVATRRNIGIFELPGGIVSIAFSPDGAILASAEGYNGRAGLWDVATGVQIGVFPHTSGVFSISLSSDGTILASGTGGGTIELWDMSPYITATTSSKFSAEDVNQDGVVNIQDLVLVASKFGETGESSADVNNDGVVNIQDLVMIAGALGDAAAAPSAHPQTLKILTARDVQQWLIQAQQLSLTDTRAQRGIHFLEHLLTALTPKETTLFANYPNPFNPETWIPYQLAEPASVKIDIHSADGKLVRTLVLGIQAAGMYQDKNRAAYWDGKNDVGEPVASGVYFYTLSAGNFTATKKLLIQK